MGGRWTFAGGKHSTGCLLAEQRQGHGRQSGDQSHFPQMNGGAAGSGLRGQSRAGVSVLGKAQILAPFSFPSSLSDPLVLLLTCLFAFHVDSTQLPVPSLSPGAPTRQCEIP